MIIRRGIDDVLNNSPEVKEMLRESHDEREKARADKYWGKVREIAAKRLENDVVEKRKIM